MNDNPPQFLSTAAAAQMLGLSTTLIQSLVDRNELQGWKTRGGHRRISLQSIHDYQTNARMIHSAPPRPKAQPRIMIAVETPETLNALQQQSSSWDFSLKLKFIDSITEAMLSLGTDRPDLLVVELAMPRVQQERALMALENFNAKRRPISMVLVTQEIHLHSKSQESNKFIQIAPGPLSAVWLHAYLTGVVAICRS
jgi:excisionase family DNA binding protein